MISTILFDLDGTIIDSEPIAFKAILEITAGWGVKIRPEEAAVVAGKKWEVAFDLLYERYPISLPKAEASRQIIERYKELIKIELRVVPGVIAAIEDCAKHFRLGLVSGSHRAEIIWALETLKIRDRFEVLLGAEDYPASKPAPDGYAKALSLFNAQAKHAIVFEDSAAGIASARAAGIPVVAISSTNYFNHDLSGANHKIPDFQLVTADWIKALRF